MCGVGRRTMRRCVRGSVNVRLMVGGREVRRRRPALLLEVDGVPGVWMSAPVARLYRDVMSAALRAELHRDPGAARVRDDLMITQTLLKLGSGTGTEVADGDDCGASSDAVDPASLSVADAAPVLGIGDRGVRKAIEAGRLRATRVGHAWVIDPMDLQHFIRRREAV